MRLDCNLRLDFKGQADVQMDGKGKQCIYIIDNSFALNQFDFIENCEALSNFVLPDTVLKYMNRK